MQKQTELDFFSIFFITSVRNEIYLLKIEVYNRVICTFIIAFLFIWKMPFLNDWINGIHFSIACVHSALNGEMHATRWMCFFRPFYVILFKPTSRKPIPTMNLHRESGRPFSQHIGIWGKMIFFLWNVFDHG